MSTAPLNPAATLTAAGHARATLALGLPLAGSQLAQMALHVTDMLMVGWYGVTELAAVTLGSASFFIIYVLGSGFAQALTAMVASGVARGDETQVRRDTRMGLWLSAAFGLAVYPLFAGAGALFLWLGQPPEVAALAGQYMAVVGLGMVPALWVRVLASFLSALERTRVMLWATVAAVGLNAAVNWALIFGHWGAPELGVLGAAVATVVTQGATLVALALYAARAEGLRRFRLFQRLWRPDWAAGVRVARLGLPVGLTAVAEGGMFEASVLMMGWIGTLELAAHGIAMQIASITFMLHVGLATAATVRTGQALGRGDAAGLRLGARVAIGLSLAVVGATVAAFLLLPEPLLRLFLDADDPRAAEIVALGVVFLALAAAFQLADATQVLALGLLRGLQDTTVPMWIAGFSYWAVGIPASWLLAFPLGLGGAGLWAGLVLGLSCAGTLLMLRFWRRAPRPAA
jgi:MATE family multidrug resistance protein